MYKINIYFIYLMYSGGNLENRKKTYIYMKQIFILTWVPFPKGPGNLTNKKRIHINSFYLFYLFYFQSFRQNKSNKKIDRALVGLRFQAHGCLHGLRCGLPGMVHLRGFAVAGSRDRKSPKIDGQSKVPKSQWPTAFFGGLIINK